MTPPARRLAEAVLPVLVGLLLAGVVESGSAQRPAWLTVVGQVAGLGAGAALWWRRAHPVPVMVAVLAGSAVVQVVAPYGLFPFAGFVALYALAASRPPWISLPATVGLAGVTALSAGTEAAGDVGFVMAGSPVVWAVGEATRNRTIAVREAALRVMSEQQAALARELHDVIGHSVTVMVVQAAAADDVFDTRPDQARTALRAVETTGRAALAELRSLLPAVRDGARLPAPARGLDRLDELVERLAATGLTVGVHREITSRGADHLTDVDVDRCAYRVVQESLTNTVRHARATRADVLVRRTADRLEVEIRDDGGPQHRCPHDGRPPDGSTGGPTSAGTGLAGMRERVEELGGRFTAGPHPDGGFVVTAHLPLTGRRP